MKRWFDKYGAFDEDDALRLIGRRFEGYARGGGSSSGGSGGGGSSSSSYHQSGGAETILRDLATMIEMIEDFFSEKGLDARTYMESHRRGGGRGN
jgi:hypothetical protein